MAQNPFAELIERVGELERRQGNFMRKVKVTKSHKDGTVTVSDEQGFDPKPMAQMSITSGDWTFDAPADEGAQGMVFCPEGDPSQGVFFPCLPSDDKKHASKDPKTMRIKGPAGFELEVTEGVATIKGVTLNMGGEGPAVARKGDKVECPAGIGHIIEGSSIVNAVD